MSGQQSKRKLWEPDENEVLMGLWDTVGSVILIALMMGRSASSIQTQASRLGLPARFEEKDRHRRKWSDEDDDILTEQELNHTTPEGRIDIKAMSANMGRSIDAILSRMENMYGEDANILSRIIVPYETPNRKLDVPITFKNAKAGEKKKECLRCHEGFWSEGKHNWICTPCKRPNGLWD